MIETIGKYAPVQRGINGSTQPRFNNEKTFANFSSIFNFWQNDLQKEPAWGSSSRERDRWLSWVWKKEPYLAGVLNSVVQIDKNRGWTLTGGRNQVMRFKRVFHNNLYYQPDLYGWRMFTGGMSQAFYTTDMGSIAEVNRDSDDGPMTGLYFTDGTSCELTGDMETPLKYLPGKGKAQRWTNNDYFRVVSMPQPDAATKGLGFCAVSRALELLKIMIGIYQYDNEMLLNQAPRGLLLLKGIDQQQWEDAMKIRKAKLEGERYQYYQALSVLATLDPTVEIDANLIALSQLPSEFNQEIFTNLLMYGYALIFGYDAREFWPVSGGPLGTGAETETQHRKAGAKGGLDFALAYQEKLQGRLPDTIQFEFDERDQDGELAEAQLNQAKEKYILDMLNMYQAAIEGMGQTLITREEARILLAQEGLIPDEWTITEEDVTATDEEGVSRSERVQRAIYNFPDENIISYTWPLGKTRIIAKAGRIVSRSYTVIKRQTDDIQEYINTLETLTDDAIEGDISEGDFDRQLMILTAAILGLSLLTDNDTPEAQAVKDIAREVLNNPTLDNQLAAQELLFDLQAMEIAIGDSEAFDSYEEELVNSQESTLAQDIYAGNYDDNREGLLSRIGMWGLTAYSLYNLGRMTYNLTRNFQWHLGATEKHCTDCLRLNGQVHTGQEWKDAGWRPQSRRLDCNGYNCDCKLRRTTRDVTGEF